jgi:hypothetical protein
MWPIECKAAITFSHGVIGKYIAICIPFWGGCLNSGRFPASKLGVDRTSDSIQYQKYTKVEKMTKMGKCFFMALYVSLMYTINTKVHGHPFK